MRPQLDLSPRRRALAVVATLTCLALSACGSQLSPQEVARTGAGGGVVVPGSSDDVAAPGVVDGGTGVVDPGADGGSGTGTGTGTGTDPGGTGIDPAAPGTDPGAPGGDGGGDDSGGAPPVDPDQAGSCDGFKNSTGITDDAITIANAADISGPVPGLFKAAQDATKAFVAYFNASSDICGRSLNLLNLDSRADAGGDQQAYAQACGDAFAVVGSVSSQDSGGAATAQGCGIPDLRAFMVTPQRQNCSTCFATYAIDSGQVATSLTSYLKKTEPEASQHIGIFYVNVEAARVNAESFRGAFERSGMNVDVLQGIDTAEFNYVPYVQQMKDNDIDFVQYFGPYQFAIKLQQAMRQQSFDPAVYLEDPTIYDQAYLDQADGAGDGSLVYSPVQLFDDTSIKEMALYRTWLEQVSPGADPNYYGLFAWSAARLFAQEAAKLGGKLSRASLVADLKGVKNWTSNGIHAPMAVGTKTTSPCIKFIQLSGSTWKQVSPGDFMCGGLVSTGVG